MQSISDALARFHGDTSWFARAKEVRVLFLRCGGDLRGSVLELLPKYEFHHDNRSAWVVLPDAHTRDDDGWRTRANRLVEHWELRRAAFAEAKESVELSPVTVPEPVSGGGPRDFEMFAGTLAQMLASLRAPLQGMVVVLAPTIVDDDDALEQRLVELLTNDQLRQARWVVVLGEQRSPSTTLLRALGSGALVTECIVDQSQQERDLEDLLASGRGPSFGVAAPRGVIPPSRVDDPPPLTAEQRDAGLRDAGVDPRLITDGPGLRENVLAAALAMKRGRGPEAVKLQREAVEIAASLDLAPVEILCRITLSSYLSGLEQRDLAIQELEDASLRATEAELLVPLSQAQLALGLLHALDRRMVLAVRAYGMAATTAEGAGEPMLAIEAWRLAGQLALDGGEKHQAIAAFQRAIALAQDAPPDVAANSSASEIARRLASLCRGRGLVAQARSLDDQAERFESGASADPQEGVG